MLEILLVRWIYRRLADTAEAKGRPRSWGFLGVALWFVGEFFGFFVGFAFGGSEAMAYLFALFSALVGGGLSWAVVHSLRDETEIAPTQF